MKTFRNLALVSVPMFGFCVTAVAAEGSSAVEASGTPLGWWIAPLSSIAALVFAYIFYKQMMNSEKGNETMEEIASYVREGAYAYLFRQYSVVAVAFVVLSVIFGALAYFGIQNPFVPVAFLTGGFFSGLCGFLGMKTATNASSRTAQGATVSLNRALQVAFRSGSVMGLVVVGFGLLDISLWYLILDKLVYTDAHMANGLRLFGITLVQAGMNPESRLAEITTTMITFGMGASTQALFARVGGGIYTKAADVGADLVGKVEAGIPEGVVNIVHGGGGEVGMSIVGHPDVDLVSFTGSTVVGKKISEVAAHRIARRSSSCSRVSSPTRRRFSLRE